VITRGSVHAGLPHLRWPSRVPERHPATPSDSGRDGRVTTQVTTQISLLSVGVPVQGGGGRFPARPFAISKTTQNFFRFLAGENHAQLHDFLERPYTEPAFPDFPRSAWQRSSMPGLAHGRREEVRQQDSATARRDRKPENHVGARCLGHLSASRSARADAARIRGIGKR
jgi:hypothetical protein